MYGYWSGSHWFTRSCYIRKERKRRKVRTYTGDILAYVWIAFGISMILIAFILSLNQQFILVNPVTLVIYGIPTFLSGIILRFRYLVLGGIFLLDSVRVLCPGDGVLPIAIYCAGGIGGLDLSGLPVTQPIQKSKAGVMEERELSEKESLQLIGQVIGEAQNYFHETGLGSLILGFSSVLCLGLAYAMDKGMYFPFHPFYLFIPLLAIQVYLWKKEGKAKSVKTFTDRAIDIVWTGYFLCSLMFTIAGVFEGWGNTILIVLIFFIGLAAFITGMLTHFRYMIFTSILCWMLGVLAMYLGGNAIYLLAALASILIWIIPGFMLRNKFKVTHQHV